MGANCVGKRDRKYYRRKIRHIFLITLLMCFFIGIGISVYWVSQAIHSAEGKSGFLPSYVASKEDAASALYPDENGKIVAAYAPSSSALEPLASEVSSQPEPTRLMYRLPSRGTGRPGGAFFPGTRRPGAGIHPASDRSERSALSEQIPRALCKEKSVLTGTSQGKGGLPDV